MSTIIDTLITDRSQKDVDRWNELRIKDYLNQMSDLERTEWLTDSKGAYNNTDLNRVADAIRYLKNRLETYGYYVPDVVAKNDWTKSILPTVSALNTYLNDVNIIRNAITLPPNTPQVPSDMDKFTFDEANDIEKILSIIELVIVRMLQSFRYCNTFYCNQGYEVNVTV